MDVSALSEANFSPADWINANYKKYIEENGGTDGDATSFIQSYVAKLQLYVQQVNYAVEESSRQVVSSMPRIAKESATLHSDVSQLQEKMSAMRQEVAAVQSETGECMATLERLNTLQTKLQAAKESLQESDGWGNLLAELEDGFERNDLKGACEKLIALQKSLLAQEQLPGHAERLTQVEDFKNRLEALASPSVVQCFAESNLEQAQHYVQIFTSIQRLPQLQQYYRAVQKNLWQQQWKQTLELQGTETQPQQQQQFLTLYYDQLLEHCQRQVKWCSNLFSEESTQPFLVIAELLPALQPTRDAHILQLLKTSNERLELLGLFSQVNHSFVLHLNSLLEQSHITLSDELHRQLGEAVFEYFHKFIQQYPRLEETQLSTQVDRLLSTQATPSDAVRHLEESTRKLYEWLKEACERCSAITSDLALCKLITLLNGIFKRQLENFCRIQRQLGLSLGSSSYAAQSENWSLLQYTMSQLQCLADFQVQLHQFEQELLTRMTTLATKLAKQSTRGNITIFQTCDHAARTQLLNCIADYQQKKAEATDSLGIFPQIYAALKFQFTETHDITLNILLQPIETHLAHIRPAAEAHPSTGIDMPSFSFAPQESITQIGQYLLTLPQHLEPLLLAPSALLKQALEVCNVKYTQAIPCADVLLSLVVEQCCILYQAQILQIKSLPAASAKQLSVDIEYLSNVLEELGLSINLQLSQILTLLKAAPDQYLTLSSGCEPRLVTAIRQMRNIISTQ
ncbi:conserved oligomeric Golgi complex subunit 7 [Drosophila guanche]|uniref:Conserved oligomeric Golgi complex subunit 7 n=1 Tax=Drosophila guanche TaxID=7266 RepID=A0A3B0K5M4_DROGU|nr:conserved oligomeric Golgi complex subunit 7 [Drosophila guanche]SPP80916.1 blast:Conserved oligomeric Golgi complex subunit 7 [Drosophila guanche]